MFKYLALAAMLLGPMVPAAAAQDQSRNPRTVCIDTPVTPPASLPPANSPPVVFLIVPCFPRQDNVTLIDPQTYLYYMQIQQKRSRPSEGVWVTYDDSVEQIMREDFTRLYNTNFLDNISIETQDYVFSNGTIGKILVYNMEERQRVKIVSYEHSKKFDDTKIDEKLKEQGAEIRLDTFIDAALLKKASGIIRDIMREKGFQFAEVKPEIEELTGGPKLVKLTFHMEDGPKVQIKNVDFIGNKAVSDGTLQGAMKQNKERWWLSWITGRGTYQENLFEEDAQRIVERYREKGYIFAQIGAPELKYLGDSKDGETRWVELRVPVVEGERYRIGNFNFEGNTVVKSDALRTLFEVKQGDWYSQKKIRKGFQKTQEVYGSLGYYEFTGYPEPVARDPDAQNTATANENASSDGEGGEGAGNGATEPKPAAKPAPGKAPQPIVDLTMRLQEGKQYFVNRITFVGNTNTRDNVIRREIRLYENNRFDTMALQNSIRRINQLGYFKPLEGPGKDVMVDKTPGTDNKLDVTLKVEEQNRNQLTFGAGVSQFEGFFGQLSFQTANFLGRGESLTVSLQGGSRAQNFTVAFTEPFLFDRNITAGINLFKQEYRYISQFTQNTQGGALTFGFPLGRGFTRMFTNYSYEQVRVSELADAYRDIALLQRNPFLADSLLLGVGGERVISKITPSIIHNTVDQPIFPTSGKRLSASIDLAGLGGNTAFYKPMMEGIYIWRQSNRTSLAMRGQLEFINELGATYELPIFEKLFLGGEYSVRGFDIRSIGPTDPLTGLVLGGNKSLLFNLEQNINIAGPVRLILFFDAGQVRPKGQGFGWTQQVVEVDPTAVVSPLLFDPFATVRLTDPDAPEAPTKIVTQKAFKTSTGAEVRFFMPVLNVPFRLIFAYNPSREGVMDQSTLRPQDAFQFRFAVGTTF
jgi:outer membrane protein insertion porin family